MEWLNNIIPNVMADTDRLFDSVIATLQMTAWSGAVMFVIGMLLGIVLTVTKDGGILQQRAVHQILDKIINICRSVPFVIFIAILLPVTKAIMGTKIGVRGVIVPLVVASVPFFARQVETALANVNGGLIEAAQAMGKSPLEIIFTVYLRESIPAIARGTTITLINLIGLTAMAGYVGAGGLGDYAITWGYNYGRYDIIWVSVLFVILIVSVIQFIGNIIARKNTH
ncbi:MAG: ABC transporter permease [Oscillospiraceae bacterium]|nr:ABC transporter permease [Oscillospiraceae bacterium]